MCRLPLKSGRAISPIHWGCLHACWMRRWLCALMTKCQGSRTRITKVSEGRAMSVQRRASSMHWLHPADEWRGNLLTYSRCPHISIQPQSMWPPWPRKHTCARSGQSSLDSGQRNTRLRTHSLAPDSRFNKYLEWTVLRHWAETGIPAKRNALSLRLREQSPC